MALDVQRNFFSTRDEALDRIKESRYWPTTLVAGPSPGVDVHWHSEEVHAYILEGETWFLDGETGKRVPVRKGDRIVIPEGALHAEGVIEDRVIYYIALPRPLPRDEFLKLRPPEERA